VKHEISTLRNRNSCLIVLCSMTREAINGWATKNVIFFYPWHVIFFPKDYWLHSLQNRIRKSYCKMLYQKNAQGEDCETRTRCNFKQVLSLFLSLSRSKHSNHRQNQMCHFVALKSLHISPSSRLPFTFEPRRKRRIFSHV
jgi:hypothetical protein